MQTQSITHTVVYTCNGDGVRRAMAVDGLVTCWTQILASHCTSYNRLSNTGCGLPQVLVESTGTENTLYMYGLSRLAQVKVDNVEWFLGDALGSVRQLVGDDGDIILARDYTPYGQILSESGTGSSRYAFTGEQWDSDVTLLFLRARYYTPQTGRFVSVDPWQGSIQQPRTLHKYLYTLANPVNLIDPSGRDALEGTEIHRMIQDHYLSNYAAGRTVWPEYFILGASKEGVTRVTLPDGTVQIFGPGTGFDGRADLADLTLQELYEIKPVSAESIGVAELAWYLSFLPGWKPGTIYPSVKTLIGPWPGDPSKEVYAQMRQNGVIIYWGQSKAPVPEPVPVFELDPKKEQEKQPGDLVPVLVTCGLVVLAVGGTVFLIVDGVPFDEFAIPALWALVGSAH